MAVVALQHAQFHTANVVGTRGGLLGEKVNPAGIAPIQNDEPALRESFFQAVRDVVADVVQLFVGREHHGNLERGNGRVDPAQTRARERDRLQLLDAQLLDHFGLVALLAAGINLQLDLSAGSFLPLLAHIEQDFVPAGSLGDQRAKTDDGLRRQRRREQNAEQDNADHQKHGSAIA